MRGRPQILCVRLYPLAIPLRRAFSHAAHVRTTADPLVIEIELEDGTVGYGETLPRPYVSGETIASVIGAIEGPMATELLGFAPDSFPEALERIAALPARDERGGVMTAARGGIELALLDAYSRCFQRPISEAVGWLGHPGFGPPGSVERVRYSGVLSADDAGKLAGSARKMLWFGLRDFKLKVGYPDDADRIRAVARALGSGLGRTTTLRLDANGAWSPDEAIQRLSAVGDVPIACVEQPLPRGQEESLLALKRATGVAVMHDESLVTFDDAERLHQMGVADWFNVRVSKNGGFLEALRLVHFARKREIRYQLGCMVGETSILSAAGRRVLENAPGAAFAEGSYGRFLLRGDVVHRPVQFGCGGRARCLPGLGWGIDVVPELLKRYVVDRVKEIRL